MENVTKFLRATFYSIVFFAGVSILYQSSLDMNRIVEATADLVADDKNLYQADLKDSNHFTLRAELLAMLMEDIPYDVSISDPSGMYLLEAGSYNPVNITDIVLSAYRYEQSYSYDESGRITKLIYRFIP